MHLAPLPEVSPETLRAIAARHGLPVPTAAAESAFTRLPDTGICNGHWLLGEDYVLRVPRLALNFARAIRREVTVVPLARAVGVRTPPVIAFDDALDLLPVPYAIYERVRGVPLESLALEPDATPAVWRAVGRDLARLHTGIPHAHPLDLLRDEAPSDIRPLAEQRAAEGYYGATEARWLLRWLDRLAPAALAPVPLRFCHADLQMANVMVTCASAGAAPVYAALIDWGDAQWRDPAWDCAGIPLRAAPDVLAGHREVAPLDGDETAEARVLWRHLHLALATLERGPQPAHSWAERPLGMLLEVVRFARETTDERWKGWLW